MKMRKENSESRIDKKIREGFITAVMTAPTLAIVLISAAYQLMLSEATGRVSSIQSVVLGVLSLVAVAASLTLGVVYKRKAVAVALATVFGLGFVCYLAFTVSGTTNLADDSFFEALMLILSLPLMSFMSLSDSLGADKNVVLLVLSAVITAASVTSTVLVYKMEAKERAELEKRKAEAEKSDSGRRKIR
jgi:hypothetical protein